jgi:predicted DCC family thiol-disulfide oxidoreductase YuxK
LALKYASQASTTENNGGPMSKVDSSTTGCPFLTTGYIHKTYAIPALFCNDDSRSIVLFDGECNLCNTLVQTLLKYDTTGNLRFAALQSRVGDLLLRRMSDELRVQVMTSSSSSSALPLDKVSEEIEEEKYKSMVVCDKDTTFIKSSAVYKILQSLDVSSSSSKRLRMIQYLALIGYILPTSIRDKIYNFVSKRRRKWFGTSNECLLWDENFEDRFVDDGLLTGRYRDPFANPHETKVVASPNLFESDSPPVRGDKVRIIWPAITDSEPSVTYESDIPDGVCLISANGIITTVDLPMRVVVRVDRESIGYGPDINGDRTMIAWVKPQEIAAL